MSWCALILAGGRATRFGGIAKHELVIDGQTIFARQVAVLASRVSEIVVSGAAVAGYRTVVDALVDGGPLAGIHAGLVAVTSDWLLVVAGDMPYLRGDVIDLLLERATTADAIAFRVGGMPEPLLCALRRAPATRAVERMLAAGERKASRLLTDAGLEVCWVEDELIALDPELRSLRNVNAPADLG